MAQARGPDLTAKQAVGLFVKYRLKAINERIETKIPSFHKTYCDGVTPESLDSIDDFLDYAGFLASDRNYRLFVKKYFTSVNIFGQHAEAEFHNVLAVICCPNPHKTFGEQLSGERLSVVLLFTTDLVHHVLKLSKCRVAEQILVWCVEFLHKPELAQWIKGKNGWGGISFRRRRLPSDDWKPVFRHVEPPVPSAYEVVPKNYSGPADASDEIGEEELAVARAIMEGEKEEDLVELHDALDDLREAFRNLM